MVYGNENSYTLAILVYNRPSVLMRVVALFSRRGYNIDSLSVSYKIRDNGNILEVSPQQARRYTEELRRHADSLRWDALILRGVIQPLPSYNVPLYPISQKVKSIRLPRADSR